MEILLLDTNKILAYTGYKLINNIFYQNKRYKFLKNWRIKAGVKYFYFILTNSGLFLYNN